MYIPIILVFAISIGLVVYMNIKRKKALSNFDVTKEYVNAKTYLGELTNDSLLPVKEQMMAMPIDAITQCLPITNLKSQAASLAATAAKTVAWAAVGVKARYQKAEHACFLVLSGKQLHYLFFEEGAIKQHLIFDETRLGMASLENISNVDRVSRMGSANKMTTKLKLTIDDKPMEILFYDRIVQSPSGMMSMMGKDFYVLSAKYEIMGKYFAEKLAEAYPMLLLQSVSIA